MISLAIASYSAICSGYNMNFTFKGLNFVFGSYRGNETDNFIKNMPSLIKEPLAYLFYTLAFLAFCLLILLWYFTVV